VTRKRFSVEQIVAAASLHKHGNATYLRPYHSGAQ
jgi:hypothetical protein